MSRSYKHTPRCGDQKGAHAKRLANRKVRRKKLSEDIPQYSGFKKLYERWNICDYEEVGVSYEAYCSQRYRSWFSWQRWYRSEPFPDLCDLRKEYEKYYVRK